MLAQAGAGFFQQLGDLVHARSHFAGFLGGAGNLGDIAGDLVVAVRCFLNIADDFLGGGVLLLDGGGDRGDHLVHLADGGADGLDGIHRTLGRCLDAGDLLGDLAGGARRLVGQVLDLAGDDGEALAGITSPGRLDGGVQSQQVGLSRDVVDQIDDLADL